MIFRQNPNTMKFHEIPDARQSSFKIPSTHGVQRHTCRDSSHKYVTDRMEWVKLKRKTVHIQRGLRP